MLFYNIQMLSEEEINNYYNRLIERKKNQNCIRCGQKTRIRLYSYSNDTGNVNHQLRCTFNKCKKDFSMWHNTIFYRISISHLKIIKIINLWSIGASTGLIKNILGIELWEIKGCYKILRKIDVYGRYLRSLKPIGGNNIIVEIDETKIGKNKHHRGHVIKGFWAIGMVERTPERRIVILQVEKRDNPTLVPILVAFINFRSIIYSDMWKAYNNLHLLFQDHKKVNHSLHFKDPDTGIHTNSIEGNWRSLKMSIPLRCRTKNFCNLYIFRYMCIRNEHGNTTKKVLKYCFYYLFLMLISFNYNNLIGCSSCRV